MELRSLMSLELCSTRLPNRHLIRPCLMTGPIVGVGLRACSQGLTLVHISAHRKHVIWNMLRGASGKVDSGRAEKWTN